MTNTSHDVWQFAIVLFVCLTGCLPWQKAALDDPRYCRYASWQSSSVPIIRQPKLFKLITSKAQRLFKKYLEPKPEKRPAGLAEIHRFLEDRWMSRGGIEKMNEAAAEEEGLCPSMYSFHSSPEEKNKLLRSLTEYGLETTVDRKSKKDRIRQWIQQTVIEEETVEDLEELNMNDEDIGIRDNQTGPVGERVVSRGPIATNGNAKTDKRERRPSVANTRRSSGVYSQPVDPRIPLEQQKDKKVQKKVQFNEVVAQNCISPKSSPVGSPVVSRMQKSNMKETKNERKPAMPFNIQNALPFQNLKIVNSITSLESLQSTDSTTTTFRHKINVQLPQSEAYFYSPRNSPVANRKIVNGNAINGVANNNAASNGMQNSPVTSRVAPKMENKGFVGYNNVEGKVNSKKSPSRSPSK